MSSPIIPPPVIALVIALTMVFISKMTGDFTVSFPFQRSLAGVFAGLGVAIDLVSIAAFARAKTTVNPLSPDKANKLVVSGLYRISRNPMYLGLLLILTGLAIWLGNPVNVILIGVFMVLINEFQIKPEEVALEEKFGDDYQAYKKKVRRWI